MRIEDLKGNQLLEIIGFLNLKEILSFSLVCKAFNTFLIKHQAFVQRMCLTYIGLEYSDSTLGWNQILQNLHQAIDPPAMLFFLIIQMEELAFVVIIIL